MTAILTAAAQQLLAQARQMHAAGQLESAVAVCEQLLTAAPEHAESWLLLGLIAAEQGMPDEAQSFLAQAFALAPESTAEALQAAIRYQQQAKLAQAECVCRAILNTQPHHADALHLLGVVLFQQQRLDEATQLLEQAVALAPQALQFLGNLGMCYQAAGQFSKAAPCLERVLQLKPENAVNRVALINVLRELQRYEEALALFPPLLKTQPDNVDLHHMRGVILWMNNDLVGALSAFDYCLKLNQRFSAAHDAMVCLLEAEPDHALTQQAFHAALAALSRAPQLHSVLAYASDFNPTLDAAAQQQVRRDYYLQQIVPQKIHPLALKVSKAPDKKLRIGFMPGRFYRNASVYAYMPVLLRLDRERFEVWCYDNFKHADEFTEQIRARADGWCDITQLSDAEVAHRIRDDKIDILVDLFAHAGGNRLPIYAYKPAPVQVTAWGHANGTGMACMDYLFSDPVSIPPDEVHLYAEHVHYLPCQLSYWLPENAPPVAPLPMEKNGCITFGCFNRMIKVSDAVLEVWADLLAQVPGSRLVLKAAELEDPLQCERVLTIFRRHGVAEERLTFHRSSPWYDHLQRYAEVDFALDPFPMGGGVTTLDALWMGVPVLCLRGKTLGQRITSAIMSAIGLGDWVSETPAGYTQLAIAKTQCPDELRQLRATLRRRMALSPLANPDYYVGCVEDAFIAFWHAWCRNEKLPQPATSNFAVAAHAAQADRLWRDFLRNPDAPDVQQRLADSMQRAGKTRLAAEFYATSLTPKL